MRCAGCSIRNEVDAAAVLVRQSCRRGAVQLAEAVPLIDAAAGAGDPVHGVTAFQEMLVQGEHVPLRAVL